MVSEQEMLLKFAKDKNTTIVFGDMGRNPAHLSYTIDVCFGLDKEVRIFSEYWESLNVHPSYEDDGTRCDILLYVEPKFGATIFKPIYADHFIVFTSHLNLRILDTNYRIATIHIGNRDKLPRNWRGFVECCEDEKSHDFTFKPTLFHFNHVDIPNNATVCADLTKCNTSHEAYLCFLNVRDVLIQNDTHKSWTCALPYHLREDIKQCLNVSDERLRENHLMETNTDGVLSLRKIYTIP